MSTRPVSRDALLSMNLRAVQPRLDRADLEQTIFRMGELIGDEKLAAAILDRLLHHATTIPITFESYRRKDKRLDGVLPARKQPR